MAACDYRLCDVCGRKAFYDANLNYDIGRDVVGSVRNAGQMNSNMSLDYLGDWGVICDRCTDTHEVVVRPKAATPPAGAGEAVLVRGSWLHESDVLTLQQIIASTYTLTNERLPADVRDYLRNLAGRIPNVPTATPTPLREAVRDAERYRWLLDYDGEDVSPAAQAAWEAFCSPLRKEHIDAAIDAALQADTARAEGS